MKKMPESSPDVIVELINAFRRSKTMFAATQLGVFDHLADSAPLSLAELAQRTSVRPEPLSRLLDACCALGLLRRDGPLYSNAPAAARYLARQSPDSLAGYVLYSNEALWQLWARLEDSLREGSPRWRQAFGIEGPIFSGFFRTPEARRAFIQGMHGFGRLSSPAVVRAFNLSRFNQIADLGGATGHLAIAACERYGAMRGIVFDLPEVVAFAQPCLAASRAADRLAAVAGDFFIDPLPPADLYALGRILHDWPDEKIFMLLRRIHAALPPGGGLLIAETLLDDDGLGPIPALMQSLNMLVCTEGRERTAGGYADLLEECGFHKVEARRTGAPLDAVLAIRKE